MQPKAPLASRDGSLKLPNGHKSAVGVQSDFPVKRTSQESHLAGGRAGRVSSPSGALQDKAQSISSG